MRVSIHLLVAIALGLLSSCGSEPAVGVSGSSSPSTQSTTTAADTPSSTTPELLALASEDDPYRLYYLANFLPDSIESHQASSYLIASANTLEDLPDFGDVQIPFGLPPTSAALVTGVPDDEDAPFQIPHRTLWPTECLGLSPDIDGDFLLDDCDPYADDGPLTPQINEAREVDPAVTLESWNEVRAGRGLPPLTMPDEAMPVSDAVREWCARNFRDRLTDIPEDFGLSQADASRLQELAQTFDDIVAEYELETGVSVENSDYWLLWNKTATQRWLAALNEMAGLLAVTEHSAVNCGTVFAESVEFTPPVVERIEVWIVAADVEAGESLADALQTGKLEQREIDKDFVPENAILDLADVSGVAVANLAANQMLVTDMFQ